MLNKLVKELKQEVESLKDNLVAEDDDRESLKLRSKIVATRDLIEKIRLEDESKGNTKSTKRD